MVPDIDPKVDYVFKRVCGDEDNALLLVDLLNAVLRFAAGRVVRGVAILNPFVASDYAAGKVPVLDVRARDDPGRHFLLEMQRFLPPGFAKRLLYYWASGHAQQLLKGERYELLQPTYIVCFLNETLFPDAAYHHCFRPFDAEHGTLLCKDLEVHVLELSKFDVAAEAIRTPLERWCYFFKHGASLDSDMLPATLNVPVIRKAMEVLVKLSQDEIERHRADERLRVQRDAANLAASVRDAARDAARDARQEGIEKGMLIGSIRLLQQLLQQPQTPSGELAQLPEDDLLVMEEALKQQLSGKKQANGPPGAAPTS